MTTYSRKEITEAWKKANDSVISEGSQPSHDWIVGFVDSLGITIEDPKPEPGTWWQHKASQNVAMADNYGNLNIPNLYGGSRIAQFSDQWEPARVVPAEPVDDKAARGAAWNKHLQKGWGDWECHDTFKAGWDAALAKYGRV